MKKILTLTAGLAMATIAVLGFHSPASAQANTFRPTVTATLPAGWASGAAEFQAVFVNKAPAVAGCTARAASYHQIAHDGTVSGSGPVLAHAVSGTDCIYTVSFHNLPTQLAVPGTFSSPDITEANSTVTITFATGSAIGNGAVNDVTGDKVNDIADVFADNFIEHAPTVLSLLTGVFVMFLGWRLLIVLISKINGFFRGGVSAA